MAAQSHKENADCMRMCVLVCLFVCTCMCVCARICACACVLSYPDWRKDFRSRSESMWDVAG